MFEANPGSPRQAFRPTCWCFLGATFRSMGLLVGAAGTQLQNSFGCSTPPIHWRRATWLVGWPGASGGFSMARLWRNLRWWAVRSSPRPGRFTPTGTGWCSGAEPVSVLRTAGQEVCPKAPWSPVGEGEVVGEDDRGHRWPVSVVFVVGRGASLGPHPRHHLQPVKTACDYSYIPLRSGPS